MVRAPKNRDHPPRDIRVVMINDAASVGATLRKFLPNVQVKYIERTRGLYSKTVGISLKILRAKGDIYHVNYLLQDCYLALRLGKRPLLAHAHGSDLRYTLNRGILGRIVRHNLKHANRVIVSTVDILPIAKKFSDGASYVPNPIDTTLFYPKRHERSVKTKVLIGSNANWKVKGTDIAIRALSHVKDKVKVSLIAQGLDFERTVGLARSLGIEIEILQPKPHEDMNSYYWDSDIVLDHFVYGSISMVCLEAIACGRPVITNVSSKFQEYSDFPIHDLDNEDKIAESLENPNFETLWEKEKLYLDNNHDPRVVAKRVRSIYDDLLAS
jgi:glycosyltransferase involved in cell wall biosynthesis